MKAAAIFSPGVRDRLLAPFQLPGVDLVCTANLDAAGFDALLIFGGDGSVHRQLSGLVETKVPLLVVPSGSGNDFACALGICTINDALEIWKQFCAERLKPRTIDLGLITSRNPENATQRFFCNVAGFGLDASANRRANAMPPWLRRHGGYVVAGLTAIASSMPFQTRVQICDEKGNWPAWQEGLATMVAMGNSPSYGGGMRITPRAILDDGKLDICFVGRIGKGRLLRFFPHVFRGTHLEMPEVAYVQAPGFRIETNVPTDIYADGEYAGRTPAEISIVPRALTVIALRP